MGLPVPKPLPTILLTRPQAQSEQFAVALRDRELRNVIVISPSLEILPTGNGKNLDSFEEAIFTSRNALDFVPAAQKRAWCVGDKTAEKARTLGWDAVSAGGNVDDLAAAIVAADPAAPLMHFHGEHSRGDLSKRLNQGGIETHSCVVYTQNLLLLSEEAMSLLSGTQPVIVPLFSPRSAGNFAKQGPYSAPLLGVAMSQAVFQEMQNFDAEQVVVASKPTADAMLDSIESLIDAA